MNILTRHHVRQAGHGKPLLFVHGYGCDQNVWRFVTPAFVADHHVTLMDLAGCGGSSADAYSVDRHATLHGHAEDIIAVCEAADLEKPVLVAHSVSAMSAVLAAKARPDLFDALVLVTPSPAYLNDGDNRGGFESEDIDGLLDMLDANHFNWARMMAPVIMGAGNPPELVEELGSSFCRMDPAIAKHFAEVTFRSDHRGDLAGFRLPCLILQASDDALASEAIGAYLQDQWPHAELVQLAATGHCPHMSAPGETTDVLRAFVDARPSRPAAHPATGSSRWPTCCATRCDRPTSWRGSAATSSASS